MSKVSIDKAGRVVIPKSVRKALRLEPGDTLSLESRGDEMITLKPLRPSVGLKKEHGVWVYHSGQAPVLTTLELVERDRDSRIRELME